MDVAVMERSVETLSIVIPAFNEEQSLPFLRNEMETWARTQAFRLELVMVNDGSRDRTAGLLDTWAADCTWVKVLHLSRNFGQQAALTAGLDHATGDAVVIMDSDLQDPLEVVPRMITLYQEGYDMVYGVRSRREGETAMKRCTAWIYYRFVRALVHKNLPADAGDFRLVSRKCLLAIRSMRETHRFMRGMFSWVGFRQTSVS